MLSLVTVTLGKPWDMQTGTANIVITIIVLRKNGEDIATIELFVTIEKLKDYFT